MFNNKIKVGIRLFKKSSGVSVYGITNDTDTIEYQFTPMGNDAWRLCFSSENRECESFDSLEKLKAKMMKRSIYVKGSRLKLEDVDNNTPSTLAEHKANFKADNEGYGG